MMVDTKLRSVAGTIAIGLLVMVAGVTLGVFFVSIPKGSETIVGQLIGTLLTLLGAVVTFYYGSSESSKIKDSTINTQAEATQAAQNTLSAATPSGGQNSMGLKEGEIAVSVAMPGGGTEITKDPMTLDKVLDNVVAGNPNLSKD